MLECFKCPNRFETTPCTTDKRRIYCKQFAKKIPISKERYLERAKLRKLGFKGY